MPTNTLHYNLYKPLVNNATYQDLWGGYLNDDMDIIDTQLFIAQRWQTRVTTTADLITEADNKYLILADATAASFNETLPSAATVGNGFTVAVKKTDATANVVTVVGTVDGATNYSLSIQNQAATFVSDGANWKVQSTTTAVPDASETVKGVIEIATNAETKAGVDNTRAVVPSALKFAFTDGSVVAATGSQVFPSGLIMKWGPIPYTGPSTPVSFNEPFPNAIFSIAITTVPTGNGFGRTNNLTVSGFSWEPGNAPATGYYIALGN